MEKYLEQAELLVTEFGLKIITAFAIFIIGKWIVGLIRKSLTKVMGKWDWDQTLIKFMNNLLYFVLLTVVILAALSQIGIQTTSIIAILGAAGLAVGLALQGSLANFASGVLLIIFRPFHVNDYVELAGESGFVEEIQIFTTQIKTFDNRTIILPNSMITSGKIENYSTKKNRRVDLSVGISYGDNVKKTRDVLMKMMDEDPRILKDPAPFVGLKNFGDSSLDLTVRPWCKTEDYWDVYFDINEKIKESFDQNDVTIPFPQRDVHLFENKS